LNIQEQNERAPHIISVRILFVRIQITGKRPTRPTSRTTSDIVKLRYNNMNSEIHTIHITIGWKKK